MENLDNKEKEDEEMTGKKCPKGSKRSPSGNCKKRKSKRAKTYSKRIRR